MKYTTLSLFTAVLALSVLTLSHSASAASRPKLTPGPDMQKLLDYRDSVLNSTQGSGTTLGIGSANNAGNLSLNPAGSIGVGGGNNPVMYADCTYSGIFTPVTFYYTMTYLGFDFFQGSDTNVPGTFYDYCTSLAAAACGFLISTVGAPQPLQVVFTGSIINDVKTCGTF